jgi:hypothetical protein
MLRFENVIDSTDLIVEGVVVDPDFDYYLPRRAILTTGDVVPVFFVKKLDQIPHMSDKVHWCEEDDNFYMCVCNLCIRLGKV